MPEKNYSCVLIDDFSFNFIQYPLPVQRKLHEPSVVTNKPNIPTTQYTSIYALLSSQQPIAIFPFPTTITCLRFSSWPRSLPSAT